MISENGNLLKKLIKDGRTVNHWICESVIASHLRTNYDDVSDIMENKDKKLIEQYKDFIQDFEEAGKLAQILRDRRMKRGLFWTKIEFQSTLLQRRATNIIIEEFMIVANETVAKHFVNEEIPFNYNNLNKKLLKILLTYPICSN